MITARIDQILKITFHFRSNLNFVVVGFFVCLYVVGFFAVVFDVLFSFGTSFFHSVQNSLCLFSAFFWINGIVVVLLHIHIVNVVPKVAICFTIRIHFHCAGILWISVGNADAVCAQLLSRACSREKWRTKHDHERNTHDTQRTWFHVQKQEESV